MAYVASNILEHYEMLGQRQGEKLGEIRGKELGKELGKKLGGILVLDRLLARGLITQAVYDAEVKTIERNAAQDQEANLPED